MKKKLLNVRKISSIASERVKRVNEQVSAARHYASRTDFARAMNVSLILATLYYIISYATLFRTSLCNAGEGEGRVNDCCNNLTTRDANRTCHLFNANQFLASNVASNFSSTLIFVTRDHANAQKVRKASQSICSE